MARRMDEPGSLSTATKPTIPQYLVGWSARRGGKLCPSASVRRSQSQEPT